MSSRDTESIPTQTGLVRPLIQALHAYVPGEQPKIQGLIKLNTNENPYPPAPAVLDAVRAAVDGRLRLYPNATSQPLRQALAAMHVCTPENIIVGNGSDELLAMATRVFVEPAASCPGPRSLIQYCRPSYSLYPVLADIHGAAKREVPLTERFHLPLPPPPATPASTQDPWERDAALTLITTPNAPTGSFYSREELDRLCSHLRGVVILDEAYADFADSDAMDLALRHPHVLVARTFSKAYSLCFQRVGYFVGHPALIQALDKAKDSYNVNGLGQVAALATLEHLGYYRANIDAVRRTRQRLTRSLGDLGFQVEPSATNFLFCKPPRFPAANWLEMLRERKVLVRWFPAPEVRDYLRITIGTEQEADALLAAASAILA